MKNVLVTTLAAASFLVSGSAFANDLVDEESFYNDIVINERVSAGSTFDGFSLPGGSEIDNDDLFGDNATGAHNPR